MGASKPDTASRYTSEISQLAGSFRNLISLQHKKLLTRNRGQYFVIVHRPIGKIAVERVQPMFLQRLLFARMPEGVAAEANVA
jgi:hypothetical protein